MRRRTYRRRYGRRWRGARETISNYELFDLSVKCAGLAVIVLLLALLLVPPITRRRDDKEEE